MNYSQMKLEDGRLKTPPLGFCPQGGHTRVEDLTSGAVCDILASMAVQSACKHKDPAEVLIVDKIDTKEVLKRLDKLLYEIRAA
jgi:hypothetical protein